MSRTRPSLCQKFSHLQSMTWFSLVWGVKIKISLLFTPIVKLDGSFCLLWFYKCPHMAKCIAGIQKPPSRFVGNSSAL